jgi:CubicO group peptidase (beta-lactamase class C family)
VNGDHIKIELDRLITRNRFAGIQYTAVDAMDVRFEYAGGMRNLAANEPVLADTTFMASSSTKVITASAILQLVEKGKIRLDDPLTAHYSNHPYGGNVTIRHLLVQTSGIPNPLPLKWLHQVSEHESFDEDRALQETMRRHSKLLFQPGEKYAYSNISYWLLGKVIESASGAAYSEYLRLNIFDLLGIPSTMAGFQIPDMRRHATGYQKKFSPLGLFLYMMVDRRVIRESAKGRISLAPVYMNGPAYGGLICTATGFAGFLQDLLRPKPRLFAAETRALFLKAQVTNRGAETGMTLGWRTGRLENVVYYGKPGGGPGFRSNVRLYPANGIGVAWLINETGVSEREINQLSDSVDRYWLADRARSQTSQTAPTNLQ